MDTKDTESSQELPGADPAQEVMVSISFPFEYLLRNFCLSGIMPY